MVKYSSAYTEKEDMTPEVVGGSVVGGSVVGGSIVNDYHKAKEVVLKMSNTELHNLKEMAKLMAKLLPHIHKSDD